MLDWYKKNQLKIRMPAVAGSFYPANKKELASQIDLFLKKTEKINLSGQPKILIVPHAGLVYSGQTAAWGFKQIKDQDYQRVILLGASHTAWFDYAAIDKSDFWETPLGKVAVDKRFIDLITDGKQIVKDNQPFIKEHCLEVELIFLQKVLINFQIVPILVSQISDSLASFLAKKIADNFDEQTLLVISSDLSHYPPYGLAKKADEKTIKGVLTGKSSVFKKTVAEVEAAGYFGLETAACGQKAVDIGLKVAEQLEINNFQLVNYSNSGDFFGSKDQVVGYASIIGFSNIDFFKGQSSSVSFLDKNEAKKALEIARKTLVSYVKKRVIPSFHIKEKGLLEPLGCFVTLRKNNSLRGCIGEFEPDEPLYKVIQRMTINSAFSDPRFLPVREEELAEIKIELSIISKKRLIDDWRKIKLGVDGVVVEGYGRSGTFLPDVVLETGWSLEEFLGYLCSEKAGLPFNCYQDPKVKLYIYKVQKVEED